MSPIPVHNLPRPSILDVDKFNETKWLYTGKGKTLSIPCINYYRHGLH